MKTKFMILCATLVMLCLTGCSRPNNTGTAPSGDTTNVNANPDLRIVSGSENKTLQPIIERWARENNTSVQMDYRGSVDIMLMLQNGEVPFDAVWPANSLWTALGDKRKRVKEEQSIAWSPVVLGVKRSVARKLGWVNKPVRVDDILRAAESKQLRFMMTSATQSNSGAVAYLGYLYAFANQPQVLTAAHLKNPEVQSKIKRILGSVDRSSGSSGWLKELFLQKYDDYDAMVNYESVVIEANQELKTQNREPLYAVYPVDGLAIADSPLGYVDQQNPDKLRRFQQLQQYLLSPAIQQEIVGLGRRVGPVGSELQAANKALFDPNAGIRVDTFLNQIRYPKAEVIREALDLYQSTFRKPSLTVYCLDFSRSMEGEREREMKTAMRLILDQERARQNLLQASPKDVTVVIAFCGRLIEEWTVQGNDPAQLGALWEQINRTPLDNGTDIYSPVIRAFEILEKRDDLSNYFPAVILMTDGESNTGQTFEDLQAVRERLNRAQEVPVFGILFGDASASQLQGITGLTSGRMFEAGSDLAKAFREAKGYN